MRNFTYVSLLGNQLFTDFGIVSSPVQTLSIMRIFLFSILSFLAIGLQAQADITSQVVAAFKKNDAAAIGTFFMPKVELVTPSNEGTFEAAEAGRILTEFIKENPVTAFTVKHQGTSKLDDQFRIAEMTSSKGVFRVTFFMKKGPAAMQIKQLKIEQD